MMSSVDGMASMTLALVMAAIWNGSVFNGEACCDADRKGSPSLSISDSEMEA